MVGEIRLNEVPKGSVYGCCNCDARNYKGVWNGGKIVDKIYEIQIGYSRLHLCEECLRKLEKALKERESK